MFFISAWCQESMFIKLEASCQHIPSFCFTARRRAIQPQLRLEHAEDVQFLLGTCWRGSSGSSWSWPCTPRRTRTGQARAACGGRPGGSSSASPWCHGTRSPATCRCTPCARPCSLMVSPEPSHMRPPQSRLRGPCCTQVSRSGNATSVLARRRASHRGRSPRRSFSQHRLGDKTCHTARTAACGWSLDPCPCTCAGTSRPTNAAPASLSHG